MKLYGKLSIKEDYFLMWDIPPYVVIKLKMVFNQINKNSFQPFKIKATKEACSDLEWFMMRYPFEVTEEISKYIKSQAEIHRIFMDDTSKVFSGNYIQGVCALRDGEALRHYQQQAVDLFRRVGRLLVADCVGLGKTPTAIAAIADKNYLPAIVVVQTHLVHQWDDMIKKFSYLTTAPMKKKLPIDWKTKDVVIVKYSMLAKTIDELLERDFQTVVFDEVQETRRSDSAKTQAAIKISESLPHCLSLSGTPIYNYGGEIYSIYSVVNKNIFPDYNEFRREWLGWGDKVRDPEALGTYLQDTYSYIRRTQDDVKLEIPPVNKIIHTISCDEEAMKKIESDAKTLALSVLQGKFVERGQAARELSLLVRQATGISKAKYVAEYVKMILDNGEKVLLAGWHRSVYDILLEELKEYNPVLYTGSETANQKEESKRKFISGESQLMIISLRSGIGLDGLQDSCSYVVFGELDWSEAVHEQVIGRLYRSGQKRQVTAVYLVSDSGSDPIVVDILGLKKSQFQGIFNPTGAEDNTEYDDSIIKEFAKRYLEKI